MPHFRNPWVDLLPRQLASFARLGPLRHLDLQLPGIDKIVAGHPEAGRCHLLDGAVLRITVRLKNVAGRILPAFARVAPPPDAVHRDGKSLMRLFADRAVRHGPGLEALADRLHRLNLFDGDTLRAFKIKLQQAPQVAPLLVHLVDILRVRFEGLVVVVAGRLLQQVYRTRIEKVQLPIFAPLVVAAR